MTGRTLLVAPHRFDRLDGERALAAEAGLELVVAADTDAFAAALPEARLVLLTPYARVGAGELERAPGCHAVVRYGIGYDNVDVEAATRHGVAVAIVPDASTEEVALHAVAMGLGLVRRLPAAERWVREGRWAGAVAADASRLSALDVGVVGLGRIGAMVAGFYAALGARVRGFDPVAGAPGIETAALPELLETSDLVSLHVPLTEGTRSLLSRDVIGRMRPGSIVVNVSRGGLIDEAALADALHSGQIAGAGLDVFAEEPLLEGHPLRDAPNTILTPHVAWKSRASLQALQDGAVERARLLLRGEPTPDVVNPEVLRASQRKP
jgi:D-3-phosphoglycerate dehydrogenase / 2-oxoglutarate reductase